jgi:hypothetical protein
MPNTNYNDNHKEKSMTNPEVISTLRKAELLAYKIAENKYSLAFWNGAVGDQPLGWIFNSPSPEAQAIWRDVCITYNHFKSIDLTKVVEAYNKYMGTSIKRPLREARGCGHVVHLCTECPATLSICSIGSGLNEQEDKLCEYNTGTEVNFVKCSYKKELEK